MRESNFHRLLSYFFTEGVEKPLKDKVYTKSQDEVLNKYEIRKSNKEKERFIEYVKERLAKSGYTNDDIAIEERWKGLLKTRNIVVGNPKTAKAIVTAHYDTCAISPFPNFMSPTNFLIFFLSQFFLLFLVLFISWWVMVPFALYVENPNACIYAFQATMILILIQLSFGFKNKHTANDNTSGTITLLHILEKLPKENRKDICVVFFDNEEKGLWGSLFFKKKHPYSENKLIINIDCIGDGENVVLMAKKQARNNKRYQKLIRSFVGNKTENVIFYEKKMKPMMFPSDQANFPKGIGICSLRKGVLGKYTGRIHTPFDTKCRSENIEYVSDSIVTFAKEL